MVLCRVTNRVITRIFHITVSASIIDYFIISKSIYSFCADIKVDPKIDSKHLPVQLKLNVLKCNKTINKVKKVRVHKLVWKCEKANEVGAALSSCDVQSMLKAAYDLIDINVNAALFKFNEGIKLAASCMECIVVYGSDAKNVWFDGECFENRRRLRQSLRRYQNIKCSLGEEDQEARKAYTEQRKKYKELLKNKKFEYKEKIIESLDTNLNDSNKFWKTIKSVTRKPQIPNNISVDEWFNHFKNTFDGHNSNFEEMESSNSLSADGIIVESLDCPITDVEVKEAIRCLKNNKAAGLDGIPGEIFKISADYVVEFLTKYFNKLFETGTFPEEWTESLIFPLHKKGDVDSPDNYRGISLLNISGKLYSHVLNRRLTDWAEKNNLIHEAQAGFRRQYSTIDHIFTLLACVQRQLLNHNKLYVAFIDFKKAFDFVDRVRLWNILQSMGVSGKMRRAIRSIYTVVKAKVRVGADVTDTFLCPRGLKQGEQCSPILFSFLINELANDISLNGKHGIVLSPDLIELFILLFADDVILMSYSVIGLQQQLNILCNSSRQLGLTVNMDKSKVIIFRNGGYIAAREKWFYNGTKLEVVNQYKYLGIIFSTGLTFSHALNDMASRAKTGIFGILKVLWTLENQSHKLFFKLFDAQIQPILTYGAEVWGLSADLSIIERSHLFAIKRLLNVSAKTPNILIYSESGRYPLYVNIYLNCIKYWLKLLQLPENRLPLKSYKMLFSLHCNNKNNWVSKICFTLYRYGFGHVWENQGVENVRGFSNAFKQRLIDCFQQDWHNDLTTKDRYAFYSSFKSVFGVPESVFKISTAAIRKVVIRFRLGVSQIKCHRHRYTSVLSQNMYCKFCTDSLESEVHFLLECPKYDTLRKSLIPNNFLISPSMSKVSSLLASEHHTKAVAVFLYKAFQIRNAE
jgi:hypothetical protein